VLEFATAIPYKLSFAMPTTWLFRVNWQFLGCLHEAGTISCKKKARHCVMRPVQLWQKLVHILQGGLKLFQPGLSTMVELSSTATFVGLKVYSERSSICIRMCVDSMYMCKRIYRMYTVYIYTHILSAGPCIYVSMCIYTHINMWLYNMCVIS
jgi:hypothetical protein